MYHGQKRIPALSLTLILATSLPVRSGQEPKEAEKQEPVVIGATEVVVDVIVTDKKNRIIPDLKPEEFELFEDGVKQRLKAVWLERRPEVAASSEVTAPAGPESTTDRIPVVPRRLSNLIALVFDNLSMARQSQVFARRAAVDYIEDLAPDDRVAVFGIDTRLFLVQPFTGEKKLLKKAIEQVTAGTSRQFASSAEAVERLLQSRAGEGAPEATRLAAAASRPSPGGNLAAEMEAVLLNTFRSFESLEREAQARATVLALLAIIRGQQRLPGRKAVIFFSEGFSLLSSVSSQFESVIDAANRSNVAFYTIDAGGLRIESEGERVSRELSVLAEARARGADPTRVEGGESMLGRAESLARYDRQSVLTELAEATGGLAVRNTNDLRLGLSRIDEDMRGYYVLTYEPSNQTFDGRFRTIAVKVNRPDVKVRARSGYSALRTLDAAPVFSFERPLLEMIYSASPPQDFTFQPAVFHFPGPAQASEISIIAHLPASLVSLVEDRAEGAEKKKKEHDQSKSYVGELGLLALIKDARGLVVRKLSQTYHLTTSTPQGDPVTSSVLSFQRTVPLAPGTYQVEMAARDAHSGRASVAKLSLAVPASSSALRLSSIVPTKGGQSVGVAERDEHDPLQYGYTRIVPNLSRTFSKTADQKMMFYFTVQAMPSASVRAKVEFLQRGQVLAQAPGALPAPNQNGRIQFVAEFPLAPFPEGVYDIRITVEDGTHRASEQTSLTVIN